MVKSVAVSQHAPGDAGKFVGQRYSQLVLVHAHRSVLALAIERPQTSKTQIEDPDVLLTAEA